MKNYKEFRNKYYRILDKSLKIWEENMEKGKDACESDNYEYTEIDNLTDKISNNIENWPEEDKITFITEMINSVLDEWDEYSDGNGDDLLPYFDIDIEY